MSSSNTPSNDTLSPAAASTSTQGDIVSSLNLTEQEIQFYNDEGWLYLPRVISLDTAHALREETLGVLEKMGLSREQMARAQSDADALRQISHYLKDSYIDQLVNSPNMQELANQLLGGPSTTYFPFTAVKAGGGGGAFSFHQDNQYTKHDGPSNNIWVALNPMSPDNGCLCMVPRTHTNGTIPRTPDANGVPQPMVPTPAKYLPLRMNPGDAVAFSRLTVHGSGPNHTTEPRVAYALQFHRNDTKWHNPETNEWKLLKDSPRFATNAVDQIPPKTP